MTSLIYVYNGDWLTISVVRNSTTMFGLCYSACSKYKKEIISTQFCCKKLDMQINEWFYEPYFWLNL